MTAYSRSDDTPDDQPTGLAETGTFLTDQPPATTPSHGSSNAGINSRHANRADVDLYASDRRDGRRDDQANDSED